MKDTLKKQIDNRLASIEGHIRGIRTMLVEDKDCTDIVLQLTAVDSAIKKCSKLILKNHIEHCVKDAIEAGDISILSSLNEILDKY